KQQTTSFTLFPYTTLFRSKSTLDSINFYKKEIDASKNKIQDITANVESLTQELQSAKTEITQLKNSLKTTTFLGVTMNKGLFNIDRKSTRLNSSHVKN